MGEEGKKRNIDRHQKWSVATLNMSVAFQKILVLVDSDGII